MKKLTTWFLAAHLTVSFSCLSLAGEPAKKAEEKAAPAPGAPAMTKKSPVAREKAEELAVKKAARKAEKAEKKAARMAKKEEKKAAKMAEKAEKKMEKAEKKAEKKEEKK